MVNRKSIYSKGDKRRRSNNSTKQISKILEGVGSSLLSSSNTKRGDCSINNYELNTNDSASVIAIIIVLCPIIGIVVGLYASSWSAFLWIGIISPILIFIGSIIISALTE